MNVQTCPKAEIGIVALAGATLDLYVKEVERNGGVHRLVTPSVSKSSTEILNNLGGLLLVGEDAKSDDQFLNWAINVVQIALDKELPLLAIGGGMQVLNLAVGGGFPESVDHSVVSGKAADKASYHQIYIAPGTKLAAVVGSGGFVRVNSSHCLGVKEAQKSEWLLASAYAVQDGLIEALESPEYEWVIGVQFHPERRLELPPQFGRLFKGLIERAEILSKEFT